MEKIDKSTTIQKALEINPNAVSVLSAVGMHCLGCAMSSGETVEQAAQVHGINADELVSRLNQA